MGGTYLAPSATLLIKIWKIDLAAGYNYDSTRLDYDSSSDYEDLGEERGRASIDNAEVDDPQSWAHFTSQDALTPAPVASRLPPSANLGPTRISNKIV
jgi:hypothetical protein